MPITNSVINQGQTPAIKAGLLADLPTANFAGRLYISTDTFALYRDNGSGGYDLIGGPGTGTITGSAAANQVAVFSGAAVIGGSNNLYFDGTNGRLGVNTNTPGAAIDVHSSAAVVGQFNNTGTDDTLLAFQNQGVGKWRLGNKYNAGADNFILYNNTDAVDVLTFTRATSSAVLTYSLTAASLIKSGGTSAQFLKADGSTDSSVYITASSADLLTNKSGNISMWTNDNGYITSSALTGYLPLTGGTLTGALNGTSAIFTGNINSTNTIYANGNVSEGAGYQLNGITIGYSSALSYGWMTAGGAAGRTNLSLNLGAGNVGIGIIPANAKLEVVATTGEVFRADAAGGAYRIVADQTGVNLGGVITLAALAGSGNRITYFNSLGVIGSMVIGSGLSFDGTTLTATGGSSGTVTGSGTSGYIPLWNSAIDIGNSVLSQTAGNLSATGNFTAASIIKVGGTSAQFLKADGSTDSSTYITASSSNNLTNKTGNVSMWTNDSGYITSSALTGYLPLTGGTLTGALNGTSATFTGNINSTNTIYANGNVAEGPGFEYSAITMGYDNSNNIGWITAAGASARTNLSLNLGAGNVGIGIIPANAKLEVVATTGEVFRADAAGGDYRIVADQTGVNLGGIVNTSSRLNVNGIADDSTVQLNVAGKTHSIQNSTFNANSSLYGVYAGELLTGTGFTNTSEIIIAGTLGQLNWGTSGTNVIAARSMVGAVVGRSYVNGSGSLTRVAGVAGDLLFASSMNVTDAACIYAGNAFQQSGQSAYSGTITNFYGVYIADSTGTSVAVQMTNRWGLYQAGTAKNMLNGELILGAGNPVSLSSTNTVTNKVKMTINGTDYYLLVSTSNA